MAVFTPEPISNRARRAELESAWSRPMSIRLNERILGAWKFLVSFRKQDWEFSDYPVVVRAENRPQDLDRTSPRFRSYRYVARIVNWSLRGGGDTPEAAVQELAVNFAAAAEDKRRRGRRLPRPGTAVPIEFAPQEQVNAHPELVDDFVRRVLDIDWAWISDESSLWDFHSNDTNAPLQAKIREVYGVDVTDIESGNLAQILDRIATMRP
ncbi:MAG: hypothetical protein U0Q18_16085 [Bryobacteraceae bacterium]